MSYWSDNADPLLAEIKEAMLQSMLSSARRRAGLASALYLLLAILLLIAVYVPGAWPVQLLSALRQLQWPLMGAFCGMAGYELLLRRRLTGLLQTQRYPGVATRYVSVFLEVSLPTVILLLLAQSMGLLQALSSPAPFLYPLFVFMAVLYLDPMLCVFGGAVAALQFGLLALVYLVPDMCCLSDYFTAHFQNYSWIENGRFPTLITPMS